MRVKKVEQSLTKSNLDNQALTRAAGLLSKEIDPITDLRATGDYRRKLARSLFMDTSEIVMSRLKR